MTVTDCDREALTRAMEMAQLDPSRRWQLDQKLALESWDEVAAFAAFVCQTQALHLLPYESPPCAVAERDDDVHPAGLLATQSIPAARKLLRRLLAAGLSRYEPDPLAALARVEG